MATLKVTTTITYTDPEGKTNDLLNRSAETTVTAVDPGRDFLIAGSESDRVIWDPSVDSTENMSAFTFLSLSSDGDLDIEFETDGTANIDTKRLKKDMPLTLGSDASYTNGGDFSAVLGLIDRIAVKNPDSTAKNLKLVMGN